MFQALQKVDGNVEGDMAKFNNVRMGINKALYLSYFHIVFKIHLFKQAIIIYTATPLTSSLMCARDSSIFVIVHKPFMYLVVSTQHVKHQKF